MIRVLIADDHTLFRSGLRALFRSFNEISVIAEAQNGAEAVAQAIEHQPDIVLMDIQMPDFNGIEATRRILAQWPTCRIVMLTMFDDDDSLWAALRAGARGYVLKGADQEEMLRVIRAVMRGESHFGAAIAERLHHFFAQPHAASTPFPELTEREAEILHLMAQGLEYDALARRLNITAKTIRNHASNIFGKLHVADRAAAIVKAREAGVR